MTPKPTSMKPSRMALVVHFDMAMLSSYQSALTEKGFITIVARDLPTALLAITQHYFEVAIVSTRLGEGGDGWPLAGVLHLVFPQAYVAIVSPDEPDVLALQSAINNGIREIYQASRPAPEIVGAIVAQLETPVRSTSQAKVQ
jgi:DNA-binding NtrC family response regulator